MCSELKKLNSPQCHGWSEKNIFSSVSISTSRRKLDVNSGSSYGSVVSGVNKAPTTAKKKKLTTPKPMSKSLSQPQVSIIA